MDLFKGIELKLEAFERVLEHHAEWRGRLVLIQVTNPPRFSPKPSPIRVLPFLMISCPTISCVPCSL